MNWPAFWVGVGLLGVGLTLWAAFTIAWAATRGTRDGEDTSWGLRPAEAVPAGSARPDGPTTHADAPTAI